MRISYSIVDCSLGRLLVAATKKGICAVSLGDDDSRLQAELHQNYPGVECQQDAADLSYWISALLRHLEGQQPQLILPLYVQGTEFQSRVWQALQAIPYGCTRSYREIAQFLDQPQAARAVARACATNPIALVIPCHRVIRGDGDLGGYRWGLERKRQLLEHEKGG